MSNVVDVNFYRWGILQSEHAQLRPFQIMDRAAESMPPQVRGSLLAALAPHWGKFTPDEAWCNIIFDCAINSDLFIRMIQDDNIVLDMKDGEDDLIIPLGNVFGAAERVMALFDPDCQAWLWDAAEAALEKAARSTFS